MACVKPWNQLLLFSTNVGKENPEKILYSTIKQPLRFYATKTCYFKGSSLDSPNKVNMRLLIGYDAKLGQLAESCEFEDLCESLILTY